VAVQVNAFNFPVWGPLEKLAPALIAGGPSLIKPASRTGYLTRRSIKALESAGRIVFGDPEHVEVTGGSETDGACSPATWCSVPPSPRMPQATTGRWVRGAPRLDDGIHPFTRPLSALRIGDTVTGGPRTGTLEDIGHFAMFTGDTFYAHTGDAMTVTLTCEQISPRPGDCGEVRRDAEVTKQDGAVAATYDVLIMVAKEWSE
jgi:hypothetical protein